MKIYLEAGSGFQNGNDVYGNAITGSTPSEMTVRHLADYLRGQSEIQNRAIDIVSTNDATALLEQITSDDMLISVHINFYNKAGAEGLRGFYRSTRKANSEKCKALSITAVKALSDHADLYYHGVYNEQQDHHAQLHPIVNTKALAAIVEIGFPESTKEQMSHEMVHKNLGTGIGLGVLRHVNALR